MTGRTDRPLEVVFAVDDRYAFGAAISAASICMGLREPHRRLSFRVIDGGLTRSGRSYLEATLGAIGDVEICSVPRRLTLPRMVKYLTSATLGRLHLADVVPESVKRVLYLDADTLALGDISDLLAMDLGDGRIGARVNEMSAGRSLAADGSLTSSPQGAEPPGYFNDGVLVVDMDAWRADDITDRARQLFERHGPALGSWLDQDILNILFSGRWTRLPDSWNKLIDHSEHGKCGAGRFEYLTRREGIVHYVGHVKPWHESFPHNPLRTLYEELRAKSGVPSFKQAPAEQQPSPG